MPKLKTRRSAAKRYKVTGSGKILRRKSGYSHLMEHKSPKSKTAKKKYQEVKGEDLRKIRAMLPYM